MYNFHQKYLYFMVQNICWIISFLYNILQNTFRITWTLVNNALLHDLYTSIPYAILEYSNE